ncbi:MAG TPA: methyltransferase domain-containing protein [Thermoanaerobaculia bacterium]|nr:methyltransferase domain-containing protein [Thermoanaerobaculia bacterium]
MKVVANKSGYPRKIFNAGSGGNRYGLTGEVHVHADVSVRLLAGISQPVLATVERLPLRSESFDLCVCVGSVLNYCNAIETLHELGRVVKPGGFLILEFERSESFEYLGKDSFGRAASLVKTEYQSEEEIIWVYSESFIQSALEGLGFTVVRKHRFHVVSPAAYWITHSELISTPFALLDPILARTKHLSTFAANAIFLLRKNAGQI